MKKISRLLLFCVVGLTTSCNKEMLTPESPDLSLEEKALKSKLVHPLAAGMGPYDVLGHGYDVTGLYANAASAGFQVIDVDRLKQDHSGRVIEERPLSQAYTEEYGENAEQYSQSISNKVSVTTGFKLFGFEISSKFNYENDESTAFDGKYIYGSYNLVIKQRRYRLNASNVLLQSYLTPEFTADLESKTAAQIIKDYGPYVMTDVYTGGKMEMAFQSETRNQNRTEAARSGIKVSADIIFDVEVDEASEVNTSKASQNFSKKLAYRTFGGDPTKGLQGEINLDTSAPKISIATWQNSVTPENSVLVDFGGDGLIPIYELVSDAAKRNELKSAFDAFLENGAVENVYNPVPVYSMYSPDGGINENHVITLYPEKEYHTAVNEGIMFYAYNYQKPGTVPLYRYHAPAIYNNCFSRDSNFHLIHGDYVSEGIAFYVYPNTASADETVKPIYMYYSPHYMDHYFTPYNGNIYGYDYETVSFYVPD